MTIDTIEPREPREPLAPRLRRALRTLRNTPFHPQWFAFRGERGRDSLLATVRGGRVLDIGCADRWAEAVLPPGTEYVGLDLPSTATALYRTVPNLYGSAESLPLRDGTFDTVLLLDVLEHVADPERALAEVGRVLTREGRVLISIPFLYPLHDVPYDFQRYTAAGLRAVCARSGLEWHQVAWSGSPFETAALLGNVALAAGVLAATKRNRLWIALLPFAALFITLRNVSGWVLSRLWRSDDFMPIGYVGWAGKR